MVVHDGQTRWRRGGRLLGHPPEVAARALAPMHPGSWALLFHFLSRNCYIELQGTTKSQL